MEVWPFAAISEPATPGGQIVAAVASVPSRSLKKKRRKPFGSAPLAKKRTTLRGGVCLISLW